MEKTSLEYGVLAMLRRNRQPVKSERLEAALRVEGSEIRECVRSLRRKEHIICADRRGYWIGTPEEGVKTGVSLILRGMDITETGTTMRNSAARGVVLDALKGGIR